MSNTYFACQPFRLPFGRSANTQPLHHHQPHEVVYKMHPLELCDVRVDSKLFECVTLTTTPGTICLKSISKLLGIILTPFFSSDRTMFIFKSHFLINNFCINPRFWVDFYFVLGIYLVDKCSIMAHEYISDQWGLLPFSNPPHLRLALLFL